MWGASTVPAVCIRDMCLMSVCRDLNYMDT